MQSAHARESPACRARNSRRALLVAHNWTTTILPQRGATLARAISYPPDALTGKVTERGKVIHPSKTGFRVRGSCACGRRVPVTDKSRFTGVEISEAQQGRFRRIVA
jgi:hypothetical protein